MLLVATVHLGYAQPETIAASSGLTAYPLESNLSIDGRLDEEAWTYAQPATGFRQLEPDEGAPASQETEVRMVYGEANLYVGAILYDQSPEGIVAALGRRDDVNRADWFFVAVDSYFNRKTAYTFGVNAGGVQYDGIRSGGGGRWDMDESWDAIWESDVAVTADGWIVEMRIPYSMLRFSKGEAQRWGIHFSRQIPRLAEEAEWPLVPRVERNNMVAQFAVLNGLRDIEPRRSLQVRPYTLSRLQTSENDVLLGEMSRETNLDVGGDVKIGITSGITLDATVNPDFGQVEVDPAVLNLTAFETFYQEKRPFFLEGSQIYEFGLDRGADLLYTRRIGGDAPIIGAAKLSGRTVQGTSIGFMGATTGDNFRPNRHYAVARVSQEFGSYSSAGGILTGYLGPDGDLQRRSVTGGADWDLRFVNNRYGIQGFAVFSNRGTEQFGSEGTGFAGQVEGAKRQGAWTYNAGVTVFDDTFNPNDIGMLRRNNYINVGGFLRHDIKGGQSFGPFQRADAGFFFGQEWSYRERLNQGLRLFHFSSWTLKSFQRIEVRVSSDRIFGGYDLYETRGAGPWSAPREYGAQLEFSTDDRRAWELSPQVEVTHQEGGGTTYSAGFRSDWNVNSRVGLSAEAAFEWDDDIIAWSSNESFLLLEDEWLIGHPDRPRGSTDPEHFVGFNGSEILGDLLGPAEFQSAPIFGRRDTRALDFTLRSNVTFTPKLSLQFYGQLFLAQGRYTDFQLLQDPDTLVPFESFPKRDDFSFNNFTANAVLRWEYQPGSTLYLVWTQGRSAEYALNPLAPWGNSPYGTPLSDQLGDTFRIFPENVFLVKINYTFLR